jgi:hypothetical protein
LRNFLIEHQFTYLPYTNLALGYNFQLDPRVQNLEEYDFGLTWEPAVGAMIGIKHKSTSTEHVQWGKFFFYFHHFVSAA